MKTMDYHALWGQLQELRALTRRIVEKLEIREPKPGLLRTIAGTAIAHALGRLLAAGVALVLTFLAASWYTDTGFGDLLNGIRSRLSAESPADAKGQQLTSQD
jgi:hypothetical protein